MFKSLVPILIASIILMGCEGQSLDRVLTQDVVSEGADCYQTISITKNEYQVILDKACVDKLIVNNLFTQESKDIPDIPEVPFTELIKSGDTYHKQYIFTTAYIYEPSKIISSSALLINDPNTILDFGIGLDGRTTITNGIIIIDPDPESGWNGGWGTKIVPGKYSRALQTGIKYRFYLYIFYLEEMGEVGGVFADKPIEYKE